VGGCPPHDVESEDAADALQEEMVSAFRRAEDFRGDRRYHLVHVSW